MCVGAGPQISVRDMVYAYRRKKNVNGVDGYDLPKFNAHLDKPFVM